MTITEFITARLDEDEVAARTAAIPAHTGHHPHPELSRWRYVPDGEVEYDWDDPGPYPEPIRVTQDSEGLSPAVSEQVGPHIARHDPGRVLREIEAKRQVIRSWTLLDATARNATQAGDHDTARSARDTRLGIDLALRCLAAIWSDHPDYRDEWRI